MAGSSSNGKTTQSQKDKARAEAEQRRARAEEGGEDQHGHERNKPGQAVHPEGEGDLHASHEENTERETDDLYDVHGRESEVLEWRRHSDLDAPPPRNGYVNRFIRVRLGNVRDTGRLRNALREGWRPVLKSEVSDRSLPSIHLENVGDVIGVEDLVLCEMPEHVFKQRQQYFRKKLRRQNAAIERQLAEQSRDNVPGFGPIQQQRSSSVSVPRRQQVEVADDEL